MNTSTLSPAKPAQAMLDIIRTAAADCRAQGNKMAANELLDAASMAGGLLEAGAALYAAIGNYSQPEEGFLTKELIEAGVAWCAAIAKAQGGAA